jgi:signal peptidase I
MDASIREACKYSLAAEVLQSTGELRFRVSGISMLPTLWPGDGLTIQSHSFEEVQPGDLVLYARGGRFFIHRITRKCPSGEEKFLITRGDCMAEEDPPVKKRELLGKVIAIHRYGSQIMPRPKLSRLQLLSAWLLCHWNLLLRVTLRVYTDRAFGWLFLAPEKVEQLKG